MYPLFFSSRYGLRVWSLCVLVAYTNVSRRLGGCSLDFIEGPRQTCTDPNPRRGPTWVVHHVWWACDVLSKTTGLKLAQLPFSERARCKEQKKRARPMISIATSSYLWLSERMLLQSEAMAMAMILPCPVPFSSSSTTHTITRKGKRPAGRTVRLAWKHAREDVKEGIDNREIDDGTHKDPCIYTVLNKHSSQLSTSPIVFFILNFTLQKLSNNVIYIHTMPVLGYPLATV